MQYLGRGVQSLVDRLTALTVLGVDMGSANIKVVELVPMGDQMALRRCAAASVERGDRASTLTRLVCESHLAGAHAALALASPQVVVQVCEFSRMPKRELHSATRLQAQQMMLNGTPLGDAAIDWSALPVNGHGGVRGLLAVAPTAAVTQTFQAARAAGLRPLVVDVKALALWNAYGTLLGGREAGAKVVMVVDIGAQTTTLVIAKLPDTLLLAREVPLGAQALAEPGKAKDWTAELRDSLVHVRSRTGLPGPEAVHVTGGGSSPEACALLQSLVGVPVRRWNPLDQLPRHPACPPVDTALGFSLPIAIGLALRQPS